MSYTPKNSNGQATMANSEPVVIASNQTEIPVNDTAKTALLGAVAETAPATDTASSGLNGRLQRIAQNTTTVSSKLPLTLGKKTNAASLSVTLSSDEPAIPVTDAAMSAKLPPTIGKKTSANSLSVTVSSDEGAIPTSQTDGANVTIGAKADAVATNDSGAFSLMAYTKRISGYQGVSVLSASSVNTTSLADGTRLGNLADEKGIPYMHITDLASHLDSVTIADNILVLTSEITRPANTTTYNFTTLSNAGGNNFVFNGVNKKVDYNTADTPPVPVTVYKGGYISEISLVSDNGVVFASDNQFVVQLYSVAQTIVDNVVYTPSYANKNNLIAEIPLTKSATGRHFEATKISKAYNGTFENMYAVLVAYLGTPTSGSKFTLRLTVIKNP